MSQSFPISKVVIILIFSFQFVTYQQFIEAKTIQREVKTELITEGESVIRAKSFIVSPNYKKVACVIDLPKIHLVVNGERQKNYEDVKNLVFSPDSKRLAYVVSILGKFFVILDETEGERFEKIIDNKIIFDTADKFYYLTEDSWRNIYLVRETIVIQK